jgi:anti-anti-sigma regulatory factor
VECESAVFFSSIDGSSPSRRIVVQGGFDMGGASELADCVATAITGVPGDLVFDLTGTFIDSVGLKVIASVRRGLPGAWRVVLRRPRPFVRKVLAIAQLDLLCTIEG